MGLFTCWEMVVAATTLVSTRFLFSGAFKSTGGGSETVTRDQVSIQLVFGFVHVCPVYVDIFDIMFYVVTHLERLSLVPG